MRRALPAWLALVLVATACTPTAPTPGAPPSTAGSAAPDLLALRQQYGLPECTDTDPGAQPVAGGLPVTALPCLGTSQVVNLAGLPREPTVLNFWAQWCGPCREESPFLAEAWSLADGVSFVGVNYQDPQPDWAIEFAGLVEWTYPHVQDMERTLQSSLRIPGLPITLFVAADGRIAGRHVGGITSTAELTGLIEQYLGSK